MIQKRASIICLSLLGLVLSGMGNVSQEVDDDFSVCRLDLNQRNVKRANDPSFVYTLNNDISCYVVNESQFSAFEKKNIEDYFDQGGVIVVNEKEFGINDISQYYDLDGVEVSVLDDSQVFGTFLLKNPLSHNREAVSYGPEFTILEDDEKLTEKEFEDLYLEWVHSFDSQSFLEQILAYISKIIQNGEYVSYEEPELVSLGRASTLQVVSNIRNSREVICSYRMSAEVFQGQKYLDENNVKRGVYDIVTSFDVDAEPHYAITQYTPYISATESIIDETYIQSDVTETYTLGEEIGLSGKEIGGKVDFERSYSGSSTSQNVVNDFPFYADYRRWETTPFDKNNYNASYNL